MSGWCAGGAAGGASRVLAGLGSAKPDETALVERRYPTYIQITARYRVAQADKTEAHFGIGGGVMGWGETFDYGDGPVRRTAWGPHFQALEALVSQALTDRFRVRFGVTMVPFLHLHPVVLAAWKL